MHILPVYAASTDFGDWGDRCAQSCRTKWRSSNQKRIRETWKRLAVRSVSCGPFFSSQLWYASSPGNNPPTFRTWSRVGTWKAWTGRTSATIGPYSRNSTSRPDTLRPGSRGATDTAGSGADRGFQKGRQERTGSGGLRCFALGAENPRTARLVECAARGLFWLSAHHLHHALCVCLTHGTYQSPAL